MTIRIISYIIMLAGIIYLPAWCSFFLAFIFVFYFDKYPEAIFFGFLMDALYGTQIPYLHGLYIASALIMAVFYFAASYIKPRLRLY